MIFCHFVFYFLPGNVTQVAGELLLPAEGGRGVPQVAGRLLLQAGGGRGGGKVAGELLFRPRGGLRCPELSELDITSAFLYDPGREQPRIESKYCGGHTVVQKLDMNIFHTVA